MNDLFAVAVADIGAASCAFGAVEDPVEYIRGEIAAGSREIKVPKARYTLAPKDGETCYLELAGLDGVTIDFSGSELVGNVKTRMLALSGCTNVTLRNVVIDYADLPFTQARIEKSDAEGNWDVRVIEGYPRPGEAELKRDGDFWPLQVYDAETLELKNPMRFRKDIAITRTGEDTYRITGGLNTKGDVGDIAVWSVKETSRPVKGGAFVATDCKGCTFENMVIFSTPTGSGFSGGIAEFSADGNRYVRCALMRCPPKRDLAQRALKRLRSGNTISGAAPGIAVVGCTGLDVRGNTIELPAGAKSGAIALSNVADVQK